MDIAAGLQAWLSHVFAPCPGFGWLILNGVLTVVPFHASISG